MALQFSSMSVNRTMQKVWQHHFLEPCGGTFEKIRYFLGLIFQDAKGGGGGRCGRNDPQR
jgi:hypothetical protein